VCNGSADSQLDVLKCYTALLQHWTSILLARGGKSAGRATAVSDLVTHVNKLCLTVLQTSSGVSTHSLVLDFYETVARCASYPKLNRNSRIVIPPATLVYILHFSASPVTISRLCGLLALYKEGFQQAMALSRSDYTAEYINGFNGFLMDICNCLWRSRAFNTKDPNAHGCLISDDTVGEFTGYMTSLKITTSLTAVFTLSASPTLGSLATAYLRELEELEMEQGTGDLDTRHAGPVSKASLTALARNGGVSLSWNEYRQGVLSHLEQQGMGGVGRLMHNTMTTLMNKS
jgi:centromere protein I